jgi:hypothetical protein
MRHATLGKQQEPEYVRYRYVRHRYVKYRSGTGQIQVRYRSDTG